MRKLLSDEETLACVSIALNHSIDGLSIEKTRDLTFFSKGVYSLEEIKHIEDLFKIDLPYATAMAKARLKYDSGK